MEEINEQQYTKGFQEGYLIASQLPDLAKELSTTKVNDDRGKGMLAGIDQFEKDKEYDVPKSRSFLDNIPINDRAKDKDRGLDKE
ncbi:MAG: hypothetical protein RL204_426 [Bacteroidota bacterium]|jgi:hypothetical protein